LLADGAAPPPSITVEQVERVVVATLEETPRDATHWSRKSMADKVGLSNQKVSRGPATGRLPSLRPPMEDGSSPTASRSSA
jgi:hypothetical protein